MGLDFKIRDFIYPVSILKLKGRFEKNQWLRSEELYEYQFLRLKVIVEHAYRNVPYYNRLFKKINFIPSDIKRLSDIKIIPFLTKEILQSSFQSLVAENAKFYKPQTAKTSGTTGSMVKFYVDRPSNILEFVYYWRFWGWAGYRLGDVFAELSAQFFTPYEKRKKDICHFERVTKRLLVNSLLISPQYANDYLEVFKRFKPKFLKGLPSNLYMLALIVNEKEGHGISFKAVFSQGENLSRPHKDFIEKVFSCKVFDSYGQMERVVSISECPFGSYHIHSDYGLAELQEPENSYDSERVSSGKDIKEIIGTSLYNFSMPLIRYKTGDLAVCGKNNQKCQCNRGFPIIESITGRTSDIIITPDGRAITALYVALDRTPGLMLGQIIQEEDGLLLAKISCFPQHFHRVKERLIYNIQDFVGSKMPVKVVYGTVDEIKENNRGKFKSIISKVSHAKVAS